jgi:hypothetical protein
MYNDFDYSNLSADESIIASKLGLNDYTELMPSKNYNNKLTIMQEELNETKLLNKKLESLINSNLSENKNDRNCQCSKINKNNSVNNLVNNSVNNSDDENNIEIKISKKTLMFIIMVLVIVILSQANSHNNDLNRLNILFESIIHQNKQTNKN